MGYLCLSDEEKDIPSFQEIVSFWSKKKWKGRRFVCPETLPGNLLCGRENCPEFLAALGNRAVTRSEAEEFALMNGYSHLLLFPEVMSRQPKRIIRRSKAEIS